MPHGFHGDYEKVQQQLGRGARNMSTDLGVVFCLGQANGNELFQNNMLIDEGKDFKEGALVLKYLNKIQQMSVKDQKHATDNLGKDWMVDNEEYFSVADRAFQVRLKQLQ